MRFHVARRRADDTACPGPALATWSRRDPPGAATTRTVPLPPSRRRQGLDDQRCAVRPDAGRARLRARRRGAGASSPTSTTRCTSTSTRSRCSAAADASPGRTTRAGRTPWTCGPAEWSRSPPVQRLRRPLPPALPQPGARGHGDDGELRHRLIGRRAGGPTGHALAGRAASSSRSTNRSAASGRPCSRAALAIRSRRPASESSGLSAARRSISWTSPSRVMAAPRSRSRRALCACSSPAADASGIRTAGLPSAVSSAMVPAPLGRRRRRRGRARPAARRRRTP